MKRIGRAAATIGIPVFMVGLLVAYAAREYGDGRRPTEPSLLAKTTAGNGDWESSRDAAARHRVERAYQPRQTGPRPEAQLERQWAIRGGRIFRPRR